MLKHTIASLVSAVTLSLFVATTAAASPITYQFSGQVTAGAPSGVTVTGMMTFDPAYLTDGFGDGATYNTLTPPHVAYANHPIGIEVALHRSDGVDTGFADDLWNFSYVQIHKLYWGFNNSIEIVSETLDGSGVQRMFRLYASDNAGTASGMFAPGTEGNLDPLQAIHWDADSIAQRFGYYEFYDPRSGDGEQLRFDLTSISVVQSDVPEPAMAALLAIGAAAFAAGRRRRG